MGESEKRRRRHGNEGVNRRAKHEARRPENIGLMGITENANLSIGFHIRNVAVGSRLIIKFRLTLPYGFMRPRFGV